MSIESKVLGQQVAYPTDYCPSILVPVPRSLNREIYDIHTPEELFWGFDTWHAYEAGFLARNGLPVCGVLKLVYPANSPCIVESKSLKLYLNSLNMTRLGEDTPSGVETYLQIVKSDLEQILQTRVEATFFRQAPEKPYFDFQDYTLLEATPGIERETFTEYNENPALLESRTTGRGEIKACSHLLRSNCKITKQPDWGSIYIHIQADGLPDHTSLLKYIVSLRNENHFHEEICEMTYKRLWDLFHPEILAVSCIYTRRGGIDICPSRANQAEYLPEHLQAPETLTRKLLRQ